MKLMGKQSDVETARISISVEVAEPEPTATSTGTQTRRTSAVSTTKNYGKKSRAHARLNCYLKYLAKDLNIIGEIIRDDSVI